MNPTVVIGAGPAGLSAAHELVRRGRRPLVLESENSIGGIARTVYYKGYRFDVGGHRFFTRDPEIYRLWEAMLGDDFRVTDRLSRILYDGKFYAYPLRIGNALWNMGPIESGRSLLSYLRAGLTPRGQAENFEQWVSRRFGRRLYRRFFAGYTEKVWGVPGSEIGAEWAAQRIQDLSFFKAVANALFRTGRASSLITSFHYPRLGPGMMWEAFKNAIEDGGGTVRLNAGVERIRHRDGTVFSVVVGGEEIGAGQVLSSIPLPHLVSRLEPAPPEEVLSAAAGLGYRSFISVCLILDQDQLFPDHWIYVHSPEVRVGRIANYTNWSPDLVPDPSTSGLGMEYFCDEDDETWSMQDADLVHLAISEIEALGLAQADQVVDGFVIRQPRAYPLYDEGFRDNLTVLRRYLAGFSNLQTMGRNGLHRYNNMDHSMVTGIQAAENLFGAGADLWSVNTEESYHESGPEASEGGPGTA